MRRVPKPAVAAGTFVVQRILDGDGDSIGIPPARGVVTAVADDVLLAIDGFAVVTGGIVVLALNVTADRGGASEGADGSRSPTATRSSTRRGGLEGDASRGGVHP